MKPYFSKLLTEQERAGSRNPSIKTGLRLKYDPDSDYDDQPTRAKMCRRNKQNPLGDYNWKELTDVLSPLYGYLEKNVGRPWDMVYSELCQGLDRRSVSGQHVFTHLWQYVDTNCWIGADTGTVYTDGRRGPDTPDDFYVHPWSGLLCQVPDRESWRKKYRREQANKPIEEIKVSPEKSYNLIDGIWYFTEYTMVKVWRERVDYSGRVRLDGPFFDAVFHNKRQLSKKELRYLKLKNQLP